MKSTYCQQCGTKNTYEIQRPNFCIDCGTRFSWASVPNKPQPQKNKKEEVEDEDDEEEISSADFENVKPFKFDIQIASAPIYNIDQLKKIATPLVDEFSRRKSNKSPKEIVNDMRQKVRSREVIDID